ncbi:MAG: prepilin-type N-terminal cleavage/methylation domain-containing protein [Candidatus Margulisbacteria bacterium]|jgi:prepilin-type N-terminal cleavage/methylation domain-containing protein|nr:prepilin-type N-terminal cleavage/methylation domain-containing protein [Candidatus Margulisiibacteriota bacterium]
MKKGFTLLELLITLSAGTVIVGALLSFYLSCFRLQETERQKQIINQQFMSVAEKIAAGSAQTGRLDIADLPFEDIQVTRAQNNLYKVTISARSNRQTYIYENYFRQRTP